MHCPCRWSLGVVAYEVLCGRTPFEVDADDDEDENDADAAKRRRNAIMGNIVNGKFKKSSLFSEAAEITIRKFLKKEPDARLGTMVAVQKSQWLRDFRSKDWDAMYNQTMRPPALR